MMIVYGGVGMVASDEGWVLLLLLLLLMLMAIIHEKTRLMTEQSN